MQIERIHFCCLLQDSLAGAELTGFVRARRLRALSRLTILCLAVALGACSSSGSVSVPEEVVEPTTQPDSTGTQAGTPDSLLQLEDDPGLLTRIPDVVFSEIRADTGLQIAYTREGQDLAVPGALVEEQWVYMQTCVGQQSAPPVVVVRDGAVVPFTQTDDVIYNIDGIPVASASLRAVSVVQIQEADFDGSLGSPGFNLRSIMGRLLWLSANLPERDYPFNCARQQSE